MASGSGTGFAVCALDPHFLCGGIDRVHDIAIARATANDGRDGFANLISCRRRICAQKVHGHVEHSGSAKTALECMVLVKRLLQGMQLAVLGESFNCSDFRSIGLYREHDA